MTRTIEIPREDLAILRAILSRHLSADVCVWVFGSRATGTARRYSDLDLALEGPGPLDHDTLGQLADALSESDLTIKVDIVDLRMLDPMFRQMVEDHMISLQFHIQAC